MAKSNRDLESRILQLNSRRILLEGKHRWLRTDELCEILRNPNGDAISKELVVMPPSGSIFLFDKKVHKHFRNDGYKWKKAKNGRTKEAHEKLKVEGLDALHCYYAHREEDSTFQRRIYSMVDQSLSHMVLVHYRDTKGEKRKARYIKEAETTEVVQHSRKTDEIIPNSEVGCYASLPCSSSCVTVGFSDAAYWSASSSLAVEPSHASFAKRQREEGKSKTTPHATIEEVDKDDEEEGNYINQVRKRPKVTCGQKVDSGTQSNSVLELISLLLLEGEDLSLASIASQKGKSKTTPHATIEEVDKDEREEGNDINQVWKRRKVTCGQKSNSVAPSSDSEEATPVQQGLIVPLAVVTAPPQVQEYNSATQQEEVIAGDNRAASDVAMAIDTAITDGAMSDATALSQDDETTRLAAFYIADPTVAATSAIGPIHLNPYTIAHVPDRVQPPVPQPTATIGVDIAAATNKTAAPESSNPALVQSRPTSNANQDQPQMPTIGVDISAATHKTAAPKSSKPALVQTRPTSNANQDFVQDVEIQDSPSIIQAQEDNATTRLAAFSIADPSGIASLARGPIHLNPDTIANAVDQAQDSQPTGTTGIVISATTNETAASESSNHAWVQWEPTSNANQDFAQDVVESQEKETEPTSIEPENGKSKAVVQRDFGTGKSHEFAQVGVMSSLYELLNRRSAPNTVASSSISTPTVDLQATATARAILEMDFITMASEVQRTRMISFIQSLVDSNCFPISTRPMILAMLKQLEQSFLAYSEAYSEYDMGKNLTGQVEASIQLLQPRVQFCHSKGRELQELEEKKMKIEARQAAIRAEIHGAIKETEPIQAHLKKLLLQRDQFQEKEGNLKTILDIGDGLWRILKSIIHRHLPT